jgi:hypothetical protein
MPSSRCLAVRRSVWEKAGRYPEWLDVAEDMYLDIQLRKIGACFTYVQEAVVYWELKRNSKGVIRQSFRYGFWDAQAGVFHRSYILLFLGYSIGGLLVAAGFLNHLAWLPLLAIVLLHLRPSIGRIPVYAPNWKATQVISGLLLVIYLVLLSDVSRMGGYSLGLLEMRKRTHYDSRDSRSASGRTTQRPTSRNQSGGVGSSSTSVGSIAFVPSNSTFRNQRVRSGISVSGRTVRSYYADRNINPASL